MNVVNKHWHFSTFCKLCTEYYLQFVQTRNSSLFMQLSAKFVSKQSLENKPNRESLSVNYCFVNFNVWVSLRDEILSTFRVKFIKLRNVVKTTNALIKIAGKRCKRLLHLCFRHNTLNKLSVMPVSSRILPLKYRCSRQVCKVSADGRILPWNHAMRGAVTAEHETTPPCWRYT